MLIQYAALERVPAGGKKRQVAWEGGAAVTTRGNCALHLNEYPEVLSVIFPQSLLIDSIGKELENLSF
jgi:hypothetical protein